MSVSPDAKQFEWPIRVYYEDTDLQGVVYYANYFRYMERARTEWLRSLGVEQQSSDGELLCRGRVKAAYVDADTHKPLRVPAGIFEDHTE